MALPLCSAVTAAPQGVSSGPVEQVICGLIDDAARSSRLPVGLLTRLMWFESRFRPAAISPAGAQGIAQFMPGTASEQGLSNPFDPEQAIPAAARLLARLDRQFGNIGLAAAAYNAGPARIAGWLRGTATLPRETRNYVFALTGRTAEDWAGAGGGAATGEAESCAAVTAELRAGGGAEPMPIAPWGVQLAGNFSKAIALASFERARQHFGRILGGIRPMILGTRLPSRGTARFYRVLVPAGSRAAADEVCRAIMGAGGACVVVRT
ncbi:MAG TPA: lytic transglycosylase domain-containing protein [Stellaceae bacterium]|nr:lytic transglycosylase domain-containing protein [Stellaceae bacterium]